MTIVTYLQGYKTRKVARKITGDNIILLVNTSDEDAEAMLSAYRQRRTVPDNNIVRVPLTWGLDNLSGGTTRMADSDMALTFNALCEKLDELGDTARCICPVGRWPTQASTEFESDACAGSRTSMSHLFMRPFIAKDRLGDLSYAPALATPLASHNIPYEFIGDYLEEAVDVSAYELVGDPELAYDRWLPGKDYRVGDHVWIETGLDSWYAFECTTEGHSGDTEPTDFTGTVVDGTVTWNGSRKGHSHSIPYAFRLPENHYSWQRGIGDNPRGSWKHRLRYSCVYLDAPEVGTNDPDHANRLELFESMLDDGLTYEALGKTEFDETAVLGATLTGGTDIAASAYIELEQRGFSGTVYHQDLNGESGYTTPLPVGDNFPATATVLSPKDSGTFVPITDVIFHAIGTDSYYSQSRIFKKTDIEYATGAIALFSQSCGNNPPVYASIDTVHSDVSLEASINSGGSQQDALDTNVNVFFSSYTESILVAFRLRYDSTGGASTATVEIADNQVILREDGGTVATINVTTGALYDIRDSIFSGLPANWVMNFPCASVEGRCARALRNGAAVVIGSPCEPGAGKMPSTTNIIAALYDGACIAQAQLVSATASIRKGSGGGLVQPIWYGDPLYVPLAGNV